MGLQNLIRWLVPKDEQFYEIMERQGEKMHEAARVLARFRPGGISSAELLEAVLNFEHEGDVLYDQLEKGLAQTFVTPIDREDIHHLAVRLDDTIDFTKTTAQTFALYGVTEPSPAMLEQIRLLVEATLKLRDTIPNLRKHAYGEIIKDTRSLYALEKEGDRIYRSAVAALFHDSKIEVRELLRQKEALEDLEATLNSCEHVADVLANLAVKHG